MRVCVYVCVHVTRNEAHFSEVATAVYVRCVSNQGDNTDNSIQTTKLATAKPTDRSDQMERMRSSGAGEAPRLW